MSSISIHLPGIWSIEDPLDYWPSDMPLSSSIHIHWQIPMFAPLSLQPYCSESTRQ